MRKVLFEMSPEDTIAELKKLEGSKVQIVRYTVSLAEDYKARVVLEFLYDLAGQKEAAEAVYGDADALARWNDSLYEPALLKHDPEMAREYLRAAALDEDKRVFDLAWDDVMEAMKQ